ncbi:ATP-binding protein [Mucilaginibacter gotjawali]|uniref:Uncharacterized protein n=2 Tax=Mucilaginibacter gotjawali TaxID=1550579 RepID=A0A110AZL1_9SPHI|nr:ATP-binding protein [Mucilaginibacter gotjawali]MBB3054295.1 ABC-type iron transport system FetAB ATPase subunit [Mucilaginibacter gotjawali]BAU51870.1 hypothetical protein MgSA37_00019 [Mucilaginibacter gotjawali]
MERLTIEYWRRFIKTDGKFDGVSFENLINELLPVLGLNLAGTKRSWDRARDFEDKRDKIWAECKIYLDNISIRIISPTLVMAIIDKPNKIYFFSYSRLNDNAIRHLSQFQEAANIPIFVFDDLLLEALILRNAVVVETFFPEYLVSNADAGDMIDIRTGFSKDPDIEYYHEELEDPQHKELSLNSTFAIDLFIRNLNITAPTKAMVKLEWSADDLAFLLLNKSIRNHENRLDVQLELGSLFFYRYYFKTLKSGVQVLPRFNFEMNGQVRPIELNPPRVDVSPVMKMNLIGKQYLELLLEFKTVIQARHQPVFFTIHGESGIGKSRLLKEFTDALFEEEFGIIKFNGEGIDAYRFREFIRSVISKVYKLPIVLVEDAVPTANELIYQLLYASEFDINDNIEKIIDILLEGLNRRKFAILIDNLQNFDDTTINFMDGLIARCEGNALRLVIVCCFNTNFLYSETQSFRLFDKLSIKGQTDQSVYRTHEITGFNDADFDLFIDNSIKPAEDVLDTPFSVKYPQTTSFFKSKVLNRPLFIEQTLRYLEQEEAIERRYDKFFVKSIDRFHDVLNHEFPKDLFGLLSRRWTFFVSRLQSNAVSLFKQVDQTIKFLCYFNIIKFAHAISYGITPESIRLLETHGFISVDERGALSFQHHQLFLFFKSKINAPTFDDYTQYHAFLISHNLTKNYFFQYFILAEKLQLLTGDTVLEATLKVQGEYVYSDYLIEFVYLLFEKLVQGDFAEQVDKKAVTLFLKLAKIVQVYEGMEQRRLLLKEAINECLVRPERFSDFGMDYCNLFHGYANACITVHKDQEAMTLLERFIAGVYENIAFNKEQDKKYALGKMQNRLCVVYKALGQENESLQYGYSSLNIALAIGNRDLEVRNYIDLANVFGRKLLLKPETIELWEKAAALYHDHCEELKHQRDMVQLYEAQANLFAGNYQKGLSQLKDGVNYCEAHFSRFFEVKYLLLQIVGTITLTERKELEINHLFTLVHQAKDLAIRYRINRSYWKTLFIEGRLYVLQNTHEFYVENAAECFLQTLDQFINVIKSPGIELYNTAVFEFMALFFRSEAHGALSDAFFQNAKKLISPEIRLRMEEFHDLQPSALLRYISAIEPRLMYNDGKYDFPVIG